MIAWGDSTIFSNFCLYQPGKAQVLLNLVEWLNHQGGAGLWWLWTLLGLAAIVNGLWLVRHDGSAWLVLVAAAACGWILGSTATAALSAREMPLPSPLEDRRLPQVVIDRTTSQAPLAKGPDNDDRNRARVRVAGAVDSAPGLHDRSGRGRRRLPGRRRGDDLSQPPGDRSVSQAAGRVRRRRRKAAGDRCGPERRAFDFEPDPAAVRLVARLSRSLGAASW